MNIADTITTHIWMAWGRPPTDSEMAYWTGKAQECIDRGIEIGVPDYFERRILGWQAGGADVPPFGPYAVPPTAPHAVPSVDPVTPPDALVDLVALKIAIDGLGAKVDAYQAENRNAFNQAVAVLLPLLAKK